MARLPRNAVRRAGGVVMRKMLAMTMVAGCALLVWLLPAGVAAGAGAPGSFPRELPGKVWIGGDSMAYQIRPTLESLLRAAGVTSVPWLCKSSSGIVRTDFMNWPNAARAQMKKYRPKVTVFMIGTNDHQDITAKGREYRFGSSGWKSIYRTRVGAITKAMLSSGAERVYWIGMPIMASGTFGAAMKTLNAIYRSEAGKRSQVTYIDAWKLFSDGGGSYVSGWRASDGIHFSMAGVERLAGAVVARVKKDL
jgi:uncharacterized protein